MTMDELTIDGVKVFTPRRFSDDRGYFMETYNKRVFDGLLSGFEFVQDNESFSKEPFTVRGLHYQAPPHAQDKLVRVIAGRVLDVVVDVRKGSPTFGQWASAELTADGGEQLLAPKGVLHGFMTLEPNCLVAYKVTDFYDAPSDGSVKWDSPSLGIAWPAEASQVRLSNKDAAAPDFDAFETPFVA